MGPLPHPPPLKLYSYISALKIPPIRAMAPRNPLPFLTCGSSRDGPGPSKLIDR
ncbi:hypothetical protein HAX54_011838, partial [Datura stramonium]|nr:hypothetical protein [Datura stramonium]